MRSRASCSTPPRAPWPALLAAAACLLLAACAQEVTFGSDPNTGALDRLVPGATSEAEVVQILGVPRGRGRARLAAGIPARDLLFYEYLTTRDRAAHLKILLILLLDGRYDGHLWFSSTEPTRPEG